MILSIDPGDTTGVALWTDKGKLVWNIKMTHEEFIDWAADDFMLSTVVVEDYVHARGQLNKKGSKLKASQGLGIAKVLAKRAGAKLVIQKNSILNIAAMHAGVPVVKHYDDAVSAYLHGYYYLETQGILKPVLQQK
jgi:hypothetical protein